MNSLKFKILGLTIAIMVGAVCLTVWHNLKTQKALLSQIATENSRILGETIRTSITTNSSHGNLTEIITLFEKIASEPAFRGVRIFDETGRILVSADPSEVGGHVPSKDLMAYQKGQVSYSRLVFGNEHQKTLIPIPNASSCQGCHTPDRALVGILEVDMSLSDLNAIRSKGQKATLLSSMGMLAILILTITSFILFYVDAPLRKLMSSMEYVEKGHFDNARTEIHSSAEMSELTNKFNMMVDRLKGLIDTKIRHERELAVSQEKLAFHDEIQEMNLTLEERLKEIEYLNITLEERLEDIEDAHFRITDLASELERKNVTLEQAVSHLSALNKMSFALNSTIDPERLFALMTSKTREALRACIGYILLIEEDGAQLRIGAAVGLPPHVRIGTRVPLRVGGISNWVIQNRCPLLLKDFKESPRFDEFSYFGFRRESVMYAPLMVKNEVSGIICMANRTDGTVFSSEDLDLLSTIGSQASVAINNAKLYQEQESTYLSTVQALVSAIEANDAYTRGHSDRVRRYSIELAKHIGLPELSVRRLEQAAILHDIGKIGIAATILNKEDALSPGDIEALRQHPVIGVRILEPIRFLGDITKIIEQHHEQFDGHGYPHGIAGENICLEARILAVADTFDAMTSDRPYRKALSCELAIEEIEEQAGVQFDPEITQAFIELCRKNRYKHCA
ncbi:HD domain-containing phosphohydrolase [Desulfuromonas sp. AOP6]|uniref:HD domain-containing phosphohydrolase n=1 Tax=Desulfuromonas sp. AOP6 TaxID=1566351 RepID=UPI0012842F7D|nr:HD domain-containing phosphohydrolase [Desulfuromonas sp. AOP6]BCA79598.1 HDIG domain-containing protein [Desulfuromonas sp. AOP6]